MSIAERAGMILHQPKYALKISEENLNYLFTNGIKDPETQEMAGNDGNFKKLINELSKNSLENAQWAQIIMA